MWWCYHISTYSADNDNNIFNDIEDFKVSIGLGSESSLKVYWKEIPSARKPFKKFRQRIRSQWDWRWKYKLISTDIPQSFVDPNQPDCAQLKKVKWSLRMIRCVEGELMVIEKVLIWSICVNFSAVNQDMNLREGKRWVVAR